MNLELLARFLGPLVVVALLAGILIALNWGLGRLIQRHPEKSFQKQLFMLIITLLMVVIAVVLLPISDNLRGQILSLLGILLSATIALSATTFLGNAMAGIMLRNVRSFKIGDFVYIEKYFGRVSGRGLFHLEIQTEDRDLLTLPNLYVTNNPVKVTRESGTIVSTEVSLGYDVPRGRVEEVLLQAAKAAGLEEPFVYLVRLGDFSVVYQVKGLLTDVKLLLSARSRLNGEVLDALHCAGVEIVSPNFMNTRNVESASFIPKVLVEGTDARVESKPEDIIFDKAEQAETLEEQKDALVEIESRLQDLGNSEKKDTQPTGNLKQQEERLKRQHAMLKDRIDQASEELTAEKQADK
ncbi:Small-conductance mechanosensitive channel [Malonomonas rubra DSM 5091]|uniref:Small-conductance mechanosensitive channel n=1 Tax=Malonomonas rubra DSM 5091 TaxID=1122189 RepID=A0A1M6KQL4_MALRU|nr:mechanosensitive ion channel family protein [Malonomonas rubra]SHJ61215.1 Small-conductance mechanosensitive channel [Malonomonas rubra DSM 5091]